MPLDRPSAAAPYGEAFAMHAYMSGRIDFFPSDAEDLDPVLAPSRESAISGDWAVNDADLLGTLIEHLDLKKAMRKCPPISGVTRWRDRRAKAGQWSKEPTPRRQRQWP
jgi:hypothetical protein